jgi:hypothetical protein
MNWCACCCVVAELGWLLYISTEKNVPLLMQLAAIRATMARSRELDTEADYLAWVDLEARLRGANHLAYPPVIAAGQLENTCYF